MTQGFDNNFDPYSEKSLDAVKEIEFLPDSIAFEHVMYANRLERTVCYEYSHNEDNEKDPTDLDPLFVDPSLMISQFPTELKDTFNDTEYIIEELRISQTETSTSNSTEISFIANGIPHKANIVQGVAIYETVNESMEPVTYRLAPEVITGLVASFLYAKQYSPKSPSQNAIELVEPAIFSPRDERIALTEQMIMSLGNHSGLSFTKTRSLFDNPSTVPIVATLMNIEFPDKSAAMSTLTLNEIDEVKDMETSSATVLSQSIVSIEKEVQYLEIGKITHRYAERRSMVLSALALTTSEFITPHDDYGRWAHMCTTFLKLIKIPMSVYHELDA
jgi:hypothetical protein